MSHLVAALGVHVDGGQEAGLRGVRVYPAQRVQAPPVLHLEYLLLVQRLHGTSIPSRQLSRLQLPLDTPFLLL